jgi:hypothetical protein
LLLLIGALAYRIDMEDFATAEYTILRLEAGHGKVVEQSATDRFFSRHFIRSARDIVSRLALTAKPH